MNAVIGQSEDQNTPGVSGNASQGAGVQGTSSTGAGVIGTSTTWIGVYGESDQYHGVEGESKAKSQPGVVGINKNALGHWLQVKGLVRMSS